MITTLAPFLISLFSSCYDKTAETGEDEDSTQVSDSSDTAKTPEWTPTLTDEDIAALQDCLDASTSSHAFAVTRWDDPTPDAPCVEDTDLNATDCSLREAFLSATVIGSGNITVCLPKGTFQLEIPPADFDRSGETGSLDVISDSSGTGLTLHLAGQGSEDTIVSASGIGDRALLVQYDSNVTLSDLMITGGETLASSSRSEGGAVSVESQATLSATNCIFRENVAFGNGGAIDGSSGTQLTFADCSFDSNESGNDGGAVNSFGGLINLDNVSFSGNHANGDGGAVSVADGTGEIRRSFFENNRAIRNGGALSAPANDSLVVTDSIFLFNEANEDGGAVEFNSAGGTYSVGECVFSHNASGESGGAIFANLLQGVEISNSSFFENRAQASGGALDVSGPFSIDRITCAGNQALEYGGCLHTSSSGFNGYEISSSLFSDNFAHLAGGGIRTSASDGIMTSCLFNENRTDGNGGGLSLSIAFSLGTSLIHTLFSNNLAQNGGGLSIEIGSATIDNSEFTENIATKQGGGIYASVHTETDLIDISETSLTGNSAYRGGGIYNSIVQSSISRCTLDGNRALIGGAIFNGSAYTNVTNSTFFGTDLLILDGQALLGVITNLNTTCSNDRWTLEDFDGELDGVVQINSCTIVNNAACALLNGEDAANMQIMNSVSAGNRVAGAECTCRGATVTSFGYNLSSDNMCTLTAEGDLISTDPELDPAGLQNNGGETETIRPLDGSPVIDSGNCTTIDGEKLVDDQRGYSRPQGESCDRGSVEKVSK